MFMTFTSTYTYSEDLIYFYVLTNNPTRHGPIYELSSLTFTSLNFGVIYNLNELQSYFCLKFIYGDNIISISCSYTDTTKK